LTSGRTTLAYAYAQGSLFGSGVSYQDVRQGDVGDCYFMATLAALAQRTPSTITNVFADNGDGTFTVRFFKNGVADYVTVDRFLPVDASGHFVFANYGGAANDPTNKLGVALAEKAYAQLNESGWIGQDNTNSYNGTGAAGSDGINFGNAPVVLKQLTNRDMNWNYTAGDFASNVVNAYNAGKLIMFGTKG